MHRLVLALTLTMLLALACSGSGEPLPTPTSTRPPATSTPTLAQLERTLIQMSVPCETLFIPGFYKTLGEGREPLTARDIRAGVAVKYQVICSKELLGDPEASGYPESLTMTISAFESPEEAREAVVTREGESGGFVFTVIEDPLLGDKSGATLALSPESRYSVFIDVAVGRLSMTATAYEAGAEALSRIVALDAAERFSENALAQQ